MISLTVVILILGATFGGIYLVYKMNKKQVPQTMKRSSTQRHH